MNGGLVGRPFSRALPRNNVLRKGPGKRTTNQGEEKENKAVIEMRVERMVTKKGKAATEHASSGAAWTTMQKRSVLLVVEGNRLRWVDHR